jgi:CRISPR/Cas system-associated protein endoribonuclease Cas2
MSETGLYILSLILYYQNIKQNTYLKRSVMYLTQELPSKTRCLRKKVTERQGRRHRQLLDDLEETIM